MWGCTGLSHGQPSHEAGGPPAKWPFPPDPKAGGLEGDDWFVLRDDRVSAARAAEAAAAVGASVGAALAQYIDEERISWLAALDGDTLRFLADLEAQGYDEDVLIK
jgi:hypothetical protein